MTVYQCDTCDGETPGGARGSTFLVHPDGKTSHFCSGACLRAYVNGTAAPDGPAVFTFGLLTGLIIDVLIRLFIKP